ncbi:MAG: serine/threonine protein kinase [Myxococcales bacterium]|nr:serine/threonine protein kinase [Myxococcales bacterium]
MTSAEPLEERPKDRYIGKQINNLRITSCIGVGGFGAVYRAEHEKLGTPFAVKLLHLQHLDNHKLIQRFEREARTIAQLSHPHVIRVSDFGQMEDGSYYLVMDYLEGMPLNKAIEKGRHFSISEVQMMFEQICSALDYVHKKNIVHRDLKPENIFLEIDPHKKHFQVKILDFGIAGIAREPTLTGTGTVLGSPLYMSPEQIQGNTKDADARSDLYSLGVVLFQTLIGEPPFMAADLLGVLYKHVHDPIPKLQKLRPAVIWVPAVQKTIERVLAKEPETRFQDAESFAEALDKALEEQKASSPDLSLPHKQGAATIAQHDTIVPMQAPSSQSLLPSGQLSESLQLAVGSTKGRIITLFLVVLLLVGGWYVYAHLLSGPDKKEPSTPTKLTQKQPTPERPRLPALPQMPDLSRPTPQPQFPTPKPKGTVTIDAIPKDAELWRGDTLLGKVPQTQEGFPGETYSFSLKAKNHKSLEVHGIYPSQGRYVRVFRLPRVHKKRYVSKRKRRKRRVRRRPPPRRRVFEIDVFK